DCVRVAGRDHFMKNFPNGIPVSLSCCANFHPPQLWRGITRSKILTKGDPPSDSSEFLLGAPGTPGKPAKILYRLLHVMDRFFQLRSRCRVSIAFKKNGGANTARL